MIWNDGKIIFDIILKTAFLGTKGRFKQMVLAHGESYELPYGEDFEIKNSGLRLENTYFWNVYPEILIR